MVEDETTFQQQQFFLQLLDSIDQNQYFKFLIVESCITRRFNDLIQNLQHLLRLLFSQLREFFNALFFLAALSHFLDWLLGNLVSDCKIVNLCMLLFFLALIYSSLLQECNLKSFSSQCSFSNFSILNNLSLRR